MNVLNALFGTTETEIDSKTIDLETLFTLHTAIDCIRYGKKSASFSKELPLTDAAEVGRYAYSVIMRFEDNFSESYQDEQGIWQTKGKAAMSLVTPLYVRLHAQAEAAMVYTNKVFKSGTLTTDKVQRVLDFVQAGAPCPVVSTDGFKFSDQDAGLQEYICFQTNVAINHCTKTFKALGVRNLNKTMLSEPVIDDLVSLKIYEKGQMPEAPTPEAGEIMTFATDETDRSSEYQIEVEETDLHALLMAQASLALWWNTFDRTSDRRNLVDIMVNEARVFLAEKQKNPTGPAFVMAQ